MEPLPPHRNTATKRDRTLCDAFFLFSRPACVSLFYTFRGLCCRDRSGRRGRVIRGLLECRRQFRSPCRRNRDKFGRKHATKNRGQLCTIHEIRHPSWRPGKKRPQVGVLITTTYSCEAPHPSTKPRIRDAYRFFPRTTLGVLLYRQR